MAEIENADIPLTPLIELCHGRWSLPVLAEIARKRGARFAALSRRLDLPRQSLSRALGELDRLDLVMHNPGYGHPLRPEYLLTPFGETIAREAVALDGALVRRGLRLVAARKWALPAIEALARGAGRFGALEAELPGVSPRALTQTLAALESGGLVERRVDESSRPPRASYALTRRGSGLAPLVSDLARRLAFGE